MSTPRRSSFSQEASIAASQQLINNMVQKENEYKKGIKEHHSLCKVVADRVTVDGAIQEMLMSSLPKDDPMQQEIQEFFQEQRSRLKELASNNAQRSRKVDAFVSSLKTLRSELVQAAESDEVGDYPDYDTRIRDLMSEQLAEAPADDPFSLEIRQILGEENAADEDDELQVVGDHGMEASAQVKCPITGRYMERPMKNKVCGHVYSYEGIYHHLQRSRACPFAGCNNTNVSMDSLEDDLETAQLIRRRKRREKAEAAQRSQQAEDDFSDDE